ELPHARAVAQRFGTEHHELVLRGCSLELLRDLNWHHDEPAGDSAAVPTYCLSHFARRHITVVLTGEGGDETFAGYPHHRHAVRLGQLSRLPGFSLAARGVSRLEGLLGARGSARFWKAAWIAGLAPAERHRAWVAAYTDTELAKLLGPELRAAVRNGSLTAPFRELHRRVQERTPLDQLLYVDAKLSLADQLLMKVDKTTMAASLEARCPLLDQDLLEYAAALPDSLKWSAKGGGKRVLRHALRGLLGDAILDRPKQGFDVPLETWLLRDLEATVEAGLLDDAAPIGRYLDQETVRVTWARFRRRRDMRSCRQIWRLLNLAVWHEIHWPSGRLGDFGEPGGADASATFRDLFVEKTAVPKTA
ncbi:MAG: asparagine synthase C-terminal domain-containing protein, partial [Acidobacteriota bacterium]